MIKVLIVEDEPILRTGIMSLIDWSSLDCEVVNGCSNGLEALIYLKDVEIDLVITDIRMPQMDGLELIEQLSEHFPSVKVILLTAYSEFEYARKALRFKVLDYVLKHNFVNDLPSAIKNAVALINKNKSSSQSPSHLHTIPNQLYDLLNKNSQNTPHITNWLSHQNIAFNNYYIFLIEVTQPTAFPKEDIMHTAEKFFSLSFKSFSHFYVVLSSNLLLVVLNLDTPNLEPTDHFLFDTLDNITHTLSSYMPFNICIGISNIHKDISSFTCAYHQALSALYQTYSVNSLTYYKDISTTYDSSMLPNIRSIAEELLLAFLEDNTSQITDIFNSLFLKYKAITCPLDKIKLELHDLIAFCFITLEEKNIFIQDSDIYHSFLLEQLMLGVTPCFICELTKNLFLKILDNKISTPSLQSNFVNQINRYIANNYHTSIKLETISNLLHVNSSYLSRLYKKETGISLTTYINQYRIQKAKILLQSHEYTISEIGHLVGISDPAYFTNVFTKYVGRSPRSYSQTFLSTK